MITLPLHVMPLLYAGVFLAAVIALWLLYDRRRERRRREMWQGLSQCRLCAEWLRHGVDAKLFRCPSCGALNEKNHYNDI
jgi:hypothetical protein